MELREGMLFEVVDSKAQGRRSLVVCSVPMRLVSPGFPIAGGRHGFRPHLGAGLSTLRALEPRIRA